MIRGIRYQDGMDLNQLENTGFGLVEYVFGREPEMEGAHPGTPEPAIRMTGISVSSETVEDGKLLAAIERASVLHASYVVIETVADGTGLYCVLGKCLEQIKSAGLKIYIEDAYSEASLLAETVDSLNREAKMECFGACLNTENGNLLGRNLCGIIERLGHRIGLLHASDNDGRTCQHQMPYTFTRGRGELSTDWYGIIGALAKQGFRGPVVYDITGLFEVSPACLRPGWYRLLSAVAGEWEAILELEEYLKNMLKKAQPEVDSKEAWRPGGLVLFGAGRMFRNYMDVWGEAYPPSYIVDNNEKLWGGMRENISIRPPSALLDDKEHHPFVLICNMYHLSIEKQLDAMGVRWRRYDDKYFFRYQNLVDKQGAGVC